LLNQGHASLKVLAAEDNAMNQLVLQTIFAQVGIWPVIVEDGAAAVKAWWDEDWDVILMDVQMPVMDGPAATRAIRSLEQETGRRPTPIIALTANAMNHQVAEYLASGMSSFVAKPVNISELFAAISEVLDPDARPDAAEGAAKAALAWASS
jgi:CheY-like chemotaxis protein